MAENKGMVRIGTSGYDYEHWREVFYPADCAKRDWFDFYTRHFDTVEINNTFYHLPEAEVFDSWAERAPEGFLFVLKFSRYGSHLRKLGEPARYIDAYMQRARHLGPKLGPILVQLPPHWNANPERLDKFLEAAPKDQRWALEFRDRSWLNEEIFGVLREHNAALCVHDLIEDHPREVTADWVYLRFHGAGNGGDYPHQALSASAQRIRDYMDQGLDAYAYFNNDAHGYAVQNARALRRYVDAA